MVNDIDDLKQFFNLIPVSSQIIVSANWTLSTEWGMNIALDVTITEGIIKMQSGGGGTISINRTGESTWTQNDSLMNTRA